MQHNLKYKWRCFANSCIVLVLCGKSYFMAALLFIAQCLVLFMLHGSKAVSTHHETILVTVIDENTASLGAQKVELSKALALPAHVRQLLQQKFLLPFTPMQLISKSEAWNGEENAAVKNSKARQNFASVPRSDPILLSDVICHYNHPLMCRRRARKQHLF